jgi:DNA-binding transcriptional MerR regulator
MRPPPWRVGELARHTGLSVRTLHHYDGIGLLQPSLRTAAGYRLYAAGDISRLQQIVSLRQLGLSLTEVGETLRRPDHSSLRIVELQLARLRQEIERRQGLERRLQAIAARFRAAEEVSVAELTQTIEAMTMFDKYYTPEQLQELAARRAQLGDAHVQEVEAEWPRLITAVRAEMDRGADPASEPVQKLARRWMELVREFTGGNPGIASSLRTLYREEPKVAADRGFDPAILDFINRAAAAAKDGGPATQS